MEVFAHLRNAKTRKLHENHQIDKDACIIPKIECNEFKRIVALRMDTAKRVQTDRENFRSSLMVQNKK